MDKVIGIIVIVLLMLTFIVLFVLNRKTPVPEGCEDIEKEFELKCGSCTNELCEYKRRSERNE